ncbi:hypothetical protein Tco_1135081 [Tanacetum coccineum]
MVAFLKKPNEGVGFTQVVDFLKASIDSKEYIITEASVRSKLQLADATGILNLSDAEIYAGLATLGYVTEGAAMDQGEGSAQPAEPYHTPIDPIPSTSQPPSPPHPSPPHPSLPHPSPPHPSLPHPSPPHPSPLHHSPPQSPPHPSPLHQSPPHSPPQSPPHFSPPRINTLKRKSKKVPISESEGEESEDQGRKIQDIDDDPLVSLLKLCQKLLLKVLAKQSRLIRARDTGEEQGLWLKRLILDWMPEEEVNTGKEEVNIGKEEVNTGREEINTGIEEVSTGSTKLDSSTASKRGQREGKAPMIEEDHQASHKTTKQIRQEEVGLEEAIKLQAQLDEEVAKQIHLDKMIAERMTEEEALSEQQKKRKTQVQFEAQFYTEKDWDAIRAS